MKKKESKGAKALRDAAEKANRTGKDVYLDDDWNECDSMWDERFAVVVSSASRVEV